MNNPTEQTMFELLDNHKLILEKQQQRLERLVQVFSRVNSVLALRPIKVQAVQSSHSSPAWSTATSVFFNSNVIGNVTTPDNIIELKGLDFHELAHILYTPRSGSAVLQEVQQRDLQWAFNALEDQRIEMLLCGRYPSIVLWLTAVVSRYFVKNPQTFVTSYPLLRGRRYLPIELRAESRKSFTSPEIVDELSSIIDEYTDLTFGYDTDTDHVVSLIQRYNDLLRQVEQKQKPTCPLFPKPFGHGDREVELIPTDNTSRPLSPKKQKNDKDKSEQVNKGDDSTEKPSSPTPSDSDDRGGCGFDDDSDDKGGCGFGDDSDDSDSGDDSQTNNGTKSDTETSSTAGSESSPQEVIEDLLQKLYDEAISHKNIATEIEDLLRQINDKPSLQNISTSNLEKQKYQDDVVDSQTVSISRSFGRELERMKSNADPSWDKRLSAGKLNSLRAMRGDDRHTVYDQWNSGRAEATDIECVVLLDISGSMAGGNIRKAYQAMWAIKRSLDKIDASTTVITFNTEAQSLYQSTEKAGTTIRNAGCAGGTDPLTAIQSANNIFVSSQRNNKILIVITDGDWFAPTESEKIIEKMKRSGILTSLAYIGYSESVDSHKCEIATAIETAGGLVQLARNIVKTAIHRQLAQR